MSAARPAVSAFPRHRPLLGVLFMCMAGSLLPMMNGVAKLMSQTYSSEQVVWARSLSHLIFVLALFAPKAGWSRILRTKRLGTQVARSCLLITSTFLVFTALRHIAIAQAAAITFTAPLLVVLLAGPMLGEKVTAGRVGAVILGFIGVLVVIRPGVAVFQWASVLALASAVCYALYQVLTRRVAGIDAPETTVVYSALAGSLIMSLVVPFFWTTPASLTHVALLCSMGVLGGLGHYCMAHAMNCAPVNFLSPFQYWQMVGAVAVGWYLFGEMPDGWTWLGAALIISAGIYVGVKGQAADRS
jgi:drug/metabolite transporter (DMT)-like permease